jgi:hypothetical protein
MVSKPFVIAAITLFGLFLLTRGAQPGSEWPLPPEIGAGDELVVEGVNHSKATRTVIVRIDDAASSDYWTRVNEERVVEPGAFTLSLPMDGVRTPRGRPLDLAQLRRLIVFHVGEPDDVVIDWVGLRHAPDYGAAVIALDLGPEGSPIFPGFEPLWPNDPRITAPFALARLRSGGDALLRDGIEGVDHVRIPVANGLWRVALYTADPGEWEYLPHSLERRILIETQTVLDHHFDPQSWIEAVYLAGARDEYQPGMSVHAHLAARRSGLVERLVRIEDGAIDIRLEGPDRAARYLAAIIVSPEGIDATGLIEAERDKRLAETWSILESDAADMPVLRAVTTQGGIASLVIPVESTRDLRLVEPWRAGFRLPARLRAGLWRLTRPDTAANALVVDDRQLTSDLDLDSDRPRTLHLTVTVPEDAPAGRYRGMIEAAGRRTPLAIEVLAIDRPAIEESIGIYLEDLPFETWFGGVHSEQRACDLALLEKLGLTAVAPPLATPQGAGLERFRHDLQLAADFGFNEPFLAYTPAKRLEAGLGFERAATVMAGMDARTLDRVFWSIADEPSNLAEGHEGLRARIAALREANAAIRLAGHLNHETDVAIADLFDLVLVNGGYGLDERRIGDLVASGTAVWLYNMGYPRLAAGFYLWRIRAGGYLQWHGRMPTADPFDPTDGREADVQLLYPTPRPCGGDIDRDLLAIAQGIEDLRWLSWLEQAALQNATASRLLQELSTAIPESWEQARKLDSAKLQGFRDRITDLARRLH